MNANSVSDIICIYEQLMWHVLCSLICTAVFVVDVIAVCYHMFNVKIPLKFEYYWLCFATDFSSLKTPVTAVVIVSVVFDLHEVQQISQFHN